MITLTAKAFIDWAKVNQDVSIGGSLCETCPVARFAQYTFKNPKAKVAMGTGTVDGRRWKFGEEDFLCDDELESIERQYTLRNWAKPCLTVGDFCREIGLF